MCTLERTADYDSVLLRSSPPLSSTSSRASELLPELLNIIFELVAGREELNRKDDSSLRAFGLVSKHWSCAATASLYGRLHLDWDPTTVLLLLRTFVSKTELRKIPRELVVNRPGDVQLWTGFEVPGTLPAKDAGMGRFRANAGANEGQKAFFLWLKELDTLSSLAIRGFSLYLEGVLDGDELRELRETLQSVTRLSVDTCTLSLAATLTRGMDDLKELHLQHVSGSLPSPSPPLPPFSLHTLELDETDIVPADLLYMVNNSRSLENLAIKSCRLLSSLDAAAALVLVTPLLRTFTFHPHIPEEDEEVSLLRITRPPSPHVDPTFLVVLRHCIALHTLNLFDWPLHLVDYLPRGLIHATFHQRPPTPRALHEVVDAIIAKRLEGELLGLRTLTLHGFTGKASTRNAELGQLGLAWGNALNAGFIISFIDADSDESTQ